MKSRIIEAMGITELRRAADLSDALAANDRVKYCFSLLQTAVNHADHADQTASNLERERRAAGVDDTALDAMVAGAQRRGAVYHLPGAARVMASIARDLRIMAAPVLAADPGEFADRLSAVLTALPAAADDCLSAAEVSGMTRADRRGHATDSAHRLVMDLHKQLNALQAALAEEQLDGAAVYGLTDADRARVRAFMAGVNRTAPLKFNHPGLGTTATRANGRLLIQNDIGTTDAHVIVIHVEARTVTVTYSDVHPERVRFLRDMLAPMNVSWEEEHTTQAATLAAGLPFQLVTGSFAASDDAACDKFLDFLGSRLVFLIDWNKARKQLRGFLPGAERVAVLLWAAREDVGHRGLLEIGGARAINDAIEATAGTAMHFGDRLCDVLGVEPAVSFIEFVLAAAARGLLAGQSRALIADRIRAELLRGFSDDERRLLRLAADHAGLVLEIASLVQQGAMAVGVFDDGFDKRAARARRFEHDADQLVMSAREAVRRRPDRAVFQTLLEIADDAADQLEDVVFLLALLANGSLGAHRPGGDLRDALRGLVDLTVEGVREWIKALAHAAHVARPGSREDTDDFLTAIDHVAALEHQVDDAQRRVTTLAIQQSEDFRQLHLYTVISDGLEETMDALKHASLVLRGHVLGEVLSG